MTRLEILNALADGRRAGDASLDSVQGELEDHDAWLDELARGIEVLSLTSRVAEMLQAKVQAEIAAGETMFDGVEPVRPLRRRVKILERWIESQAWTKN